MGLKKTPVIVDGNYYSSLSKAAIENEFSSSTFIKAVLKAETTSFRYNKHFITVLTPPYKDELKLIFDVISLLGIKKRNCPKSEADYYKLLTDTILNLKIIFDRNIPAAAKETKTGANN